MGQLNKAVESKPQDDINVIDMPADLKADDTLTDAPETEDVVISSDDHPKKRKQE